MAVHRRRSKRRQPAALRRYWAAKRRGRKTSRRRSRGRRRRGNPTVTLANGGRSQRAAQAHRVAAQLTGRSSRRRTRRRGKARPRRYRAYRGRAYKIVRRGNPFRFDLRSMMMLAGLGIAGGVGIVAARLIGGQYTKHVASHVLGAEGAADPKSIRAILNEALRLVAMGAGVIIIEQMVVSRMSATHGVAFRLGGLAETGRQAIGVVVKRVSPTTDLTSVGLSGPAGYDETRVDPTDGRVYGRRGADWYIIGSTGGGRGLSGAVDPDDYFAGAVEADEFGNEDAA